MKPRCQFSLEETNNLLIYVGDVIHHFKATDLQVRDDSNNIRFILHFLVPETHKAACEIRDCKKKTQTSRREKKMKQ
jgi:hypothetical protein